ncbi:MAG: hypothetical protein K0S19_1984, partial [Geminicoccaceae bacterium]|nr:hypothetical protein [Geminicoccaceae bacterium]
AHAGEQRVRAFTLVFNVGPAIAFGIAPLISGALIAQFDMRAAFIFAAACTAFSLFFFSRFAPRSRVAKENEPTRSSYREALAEPGVKPLLGMQFATIFSLALGISLLAPFLADQRGISPAVVAILGGVGSLGAIIFGLAVALVSMGTLRRRLERNRTQRPRAATRLHPERDDGWFGVHIGSDHLWAALRHPCRRTAAGLAGRQRGADSCAAAGTGTDASGPVPLRGRRGYLCRGASGRSRGSVTPAHVRSRH